MISKCQSKENNIWSAITDIEREGHFLSHKKKNISYNVFDLGKSCSRSGKLFYHCLILTIPLKVKKYAQCHFNSSYIHIGEPNGGKVENCGALKVLNGKHIDISCSEQFCGACNLSTLPKFRD